MTPSRPLRARPHRYARLALRASLVVGALAAARPLPAQAAPDARLDSAALAWERGDYPAALRGFEALLTGPVPELVLARIAEITGERYRTLEIARDGRAPRFHAGGEWVAFETGAGASRHVHFARLSRDGVSRDSVPGFAATFASSGAQAAFLRIEDSPELTAARGEAAQAQRAQNVAAFQAAARRVADLEARQARVIVRDLAARTERPISTGAVTVFSHAFAPDGASLYVTGRQPQASATEVFRIPLAGGTPARVAGLEAPRADVQVVGGGKWLLLTTGGGPVSGPQASATAPGFVLRNIASGAERTFAGTFASVSRDGGAVAWLVRDGASFVVRHQFLEGSAPATEVRRTTDRVNAPAISPDGRRVAFQQMLREDWELFVVGADGKDELRLTREIQHDLAPRWLTDERILAPMGEGRHQRSYLYDVRTGQRTRFFHNNTVRTIAPEYEWVASSDGSKVVVVSERDGDTVSPERGVYLVDLAQPLARDDVLARVRAQLASELILRDETRRMFAPIADQVRRATEQVSKDRLYGYQKALFAFDSKNITRPGNARAIEWLRDTYRGFGYDPELQWFEPRGIRSANVLAVLKGTVSPDVTYVVGSHFDSVPVGPGADDNTSGTSMLLETARILARTPLPATVIFVSFTGEESGLLGSREFVRRLQEDKVPLAGVINNDMMGWSNDQRLDNTIRHFNYGIRDVQHGAALHFSRLITYDAVYYKSTDAAAFDVFGDVIGGFGSYPVLGNPHYHQVHDVLETINQEQVAENTKANVATIMYLASAPQRVKGLTATREGNAVAVAWTASPEKDLREYVVSWGEGNSARSQRVRETTLRLTGVPAGGEVRVKAINTRGLESWDFARISVP